MQDAQAQSITSEQHAQLLATLQQLQQQQAHAGAMPEASSQGDDLHDYDLMSVDLSSLGPQSSTPSTHAAASAS
eukprot:8115557-Karenia_brevis.AAC.1